MGFGIGRSAGCRRRLVGRAAVLGARSPSSGALSQFCLTTPLHVLLSTSSARTISPACRSPLVRSSVCPSVSVCARVCVSSLSDVFPHPDPVLVCCCSLSDSRSSSGALGRLLLLPLLLLLNEKKKRFSGCRLPVRGLRQSRAALGAVRGASSFHSPPSLCRRLSLLPSHGLGKLSFSYQHRCHGETSNFRVGCFAFAFLDTSPLLT